MRLCLLLVVTCLVLLVLVEGRSSKDKKSKVPGSKSSGSDGKVTKVRAKPIKHHSRDSSDSSEEITHKQKKKHSEKFKSEERFDSRKRNSTRNHKIALKHNSTRIHDASFNNRTAKLISSTKNNTINELLKMNNTQSTGLKGNKTLIGWKIFAKPNVSRNGMVNETSSNVLNNFLHSEKGLNIGNGSQLHSNNNKFNNSGALPAYGWKNINASAPSPGWLNNSAPLQGWNVKPSAPDYRKEFSVPDHKTDQKYYFDSPGMGGYLQRNPNSIQNLPAAYPAGPDNRKSISNIAPEFGWGVPQPSYINSDHYNPNGNVFNSYPTYKNYGSSEENSSKKAKKAKKFFKKLGKGTGKVLSSDQVKDAVKKAASSYFANPPPNGWILNPPYDKARQTFYGRVSKPIGKESMSADDWRSVIFGNVPRKVETRNLYSAAFPDTQQNLDLNAFSQKGRLPDFNQTQYKSFFPRPYYQKLFAGLQNEEINENFRAKRELSEKGKVMADIINKFFMHERDCNDTELEARRKRDLLIRPLVRNAGSRHEGEQIITDFPFSGVEAVVQRDNGISVYEELPKEIQLDNNFIKMNHTYEEDVISNGKGIGDNNLTTTQPPFPISRNRTKLYPVSETIEEFLNKKPPTRLRVIDEPLDAWKSKARSESNESEAERSEVTISNGPQVNSNNTKRIARSQEISNEQDFKLFYDWITDLTDSDSEEYAPYVTRMYEDNKEESDLSADLILNEKEIKGSSSNTFSLDRNEHFSTTQSPIFTSKIEETDRNGFYFFGLYIDDYNDRNHVSNKASDESAAEQTNKTTPLPSSSKEYSDPQYPTTIAPSYRNQAGSSTTPKNRITPETTSSEPIQDSWTSDIHAVSNGIIYVPFKIHTISSLRYNDNAKERSKSTFRSETDSEPVSSAPSIIRAPLITNRCGPNQRMVKGRCRAIW